MKEAYKGICYVDSIFDVPYDELDVDEILFDYDGTLATHNNKPTTEVLELLAQLQERFEVRVFSNNSFHARTRTTYFEEFKIKYLRTFKPFGRQKIDNCVLVGDKFLTDGLYGLRRDITVFLIRKPWTWLWEWLVKRIV